MESSHKLTAYSVNKKVLSKVCMGSQPKGMTGYFRVESTIVDFKSQYDKIKRDLNGYF